MINTDPYELYSHPYFSLNIGSTLQGLKYALELSLTRYSNKRQAQPSQEETFKENKRKFDSEAIGSQPRIYQQKENNLVESNKPEKTVSSIKRKLRKRQSEQLENAEVDSLHYEHTLTLNSSIGKKNQILQKRQSKKIRRSQLRFPLKYRRNLPKDPLNSKLKSSKKHINLTADAISRWGITTDELQNKKQDLLLRKRDSWSSINPLCKLSREMAYFFS